MINNYKIYDSRALIFYFLLVNQVSLNNICYGKKYFSLLKCQQRTIDNKSNDNNNKNNDLEKGTKTQILY